MTHPNLQKILDALREDPEPLIEWAAYNLVALGAKSEWSMDDNFETTEGLAGLTRQYDLPHAFNQDQGALRFYGEAAETLGLPSDWSDDEEED